MRIDKDYKNIINSLNNMGGLKASDSLRQKIILLAEMPSQEKVFYPKFFTRIAIALSFILLLGAGGVYASEKIKPGSVIVPIKNAAVSIKSAFKINSSNPQADGDVSDLTHQEPKKGHSVEESDPETAGEEEYINSHIPTSTPSPTLTPNPETKSAEILDAVNEKLPEPAKGIVEGVSETLNNTLNSNSGNENVENENSNGKANLEIEVDLPINSGNQNENSGVDLNINLPF